MWHLEDLAAATAPDRDALDKDLTSSSSSSSPTSPTSSTQEAVIPTQDPASTRSESMSDGVRGDSSRGPAKTEKPK